MAFIGIDLGTTNSCVAGARSKDDQIDIIANDQGDRLTPSYVTITENVSLLGKAAKHGLLQNAKSTIFGIKRIIGRTFNDPVVQKERKRWQFEVVNCQERAKIRVNKSGKMKDLHPEEISAMVLSHMKKIAEDFLGEPVRNAVITVPAYFNNTQRSATTDAAKIAGLNVLSLINEPTAAAIAYGIQQKIDSPRTVLIFDLGGGTFDVTLMVISKESFDVKATAGDSHLGGEDFNSTLFDHFVEWFKQENNGKDLTESPRAKIRLFRECEKIKELLSADGVNTKSVWVDALFHGIDLDAQISRETFENLNRQLFESTINLVSKVLEDGGMNKTEVDDVVLVGGSTRIPYIQEMLSKYFGGEKLRKTINAAEAVAYGAAVHAAELSTNSTSQRLLDVTPLSLGTAVKGGIMSVIIKSNTKIPVKESRQYQTTSDNQQLISLKVYEGEREKCSENNLLANLEISGFPLKPAGGVRIKVVYELDSSGVLHVYAIEEDRGIAHNKTIKMDSGRMNEEEINVLIARRREDKIMRSATTILNYSDIVRGDAVVGIDYGIQNSYVAVAYGNEVQYNTTMIPSYVGFSKGARFFGYETKHQIGLDPTNTILGLKRILGRPFSDRMVQEELKKWEFQVLDLNGEMKIKISEGGTSTILSPEEICSMVMSQLRKSATEFTKEDIQCAVLTVPAYFRDPQREALKSAAEIAGLKVLAVIEEPVAAAIAHGLQKTTENSHNIIVFHLEEDTFNVSVMTASDGVFVMKGTTGDIHLGGVNFTERLFEHFADEFQEMHAEDLRNSCSAKRTLMEGVSEMLIRFSTPDTNSWRIGRLFKDREMHCIMSGAKFKSMNQDLFNRMLSLVRQTLDDAKLEKSEIDTVLLTGRYVCIYGIEEMLKGFFGDGKLRKSFFPGRIVATGAAMYASSLIGKWKENVQ